MNKEDCFYLGHTVKVIGYKGEISIKLDVDHPEDYKEMESVFIEINGQLVPFFIEQIRVKDKGLAVVKLEDVETAEEAENLLRSGLYLPLSVLPPLTGNKFYYHEIQEFEVHDKKHGYIGNVKEVLDFPAQALLQVINDKKEILIPVTDKIILNIDREKRIVFTETPEGLIELYME